jgi:hypothetical protein
MQNKHVFFFGLWSSNRNFGVLFDKHNERILGFRFLKKDEISRGVGFF